MADTPKVYVLCDQNCKYEGLAKEQIYAAIMQAVESGNIGDVDTGFITTIKTINGTGLKFFVGEQHEYDALTAEQKTGLFAIITNDATKATIMELLDEYGAVIAGYENGAKAVPRANVAASLSPVLVKSGAISAGGHLSVVLTPNHLYAIFNKNKAHMALLFCGGSANSELYSYSTMASYANGLARYKWFAGGLYMDTMVFGTDTTYRVNSSAETVYIYDLGSGFAEEA